MLFQHRSAFGSFDSCCSSSLFDCNSMSVTITYCIVQHPGKLKLATGSVVFKNLKTGLVDQYSSSDIEDAHWLVRARGHCLKIFMNNGNIHRYDGFKESVIVFRLFFEISFMYLLIVLSYNVV